MRRAPRERGLVVSCDNRGPSRRTGTAGDRAAPAVRSGKCRDHCKGPTSLQEPGSKAVVRRWKAFGLWAVAAATLVVLGPPGARAATIRVSGMGGAVTTMDILGKEFHKVRPDVRVVVSRGMGSSGGIKAVLAGQLDIGLSGRPWKNEERRGDFVSRAYARTPLVFAVNAAVKTEGLTLSEAAEIYAGRRTRWDDGRRLRLVLRPPSDSDIAVLQSMSAQMNEAVARALRREGMIVGMNDQDAADAIERTPGGFGAVTLAIVLSEKRAVRVLALDGIVPSVRTMKDGSYPYVKTFHVVTKRNPPPAVKAFLEFIRSPAGAVILSKNGQVAVR